MRRHEPFPTLRESRKIHCTEKRENLLLSQHGKRFSDLGSIWKKASTSAESTRLTRSGDERIGSEPWEASLFFLPPELWLLEHLDVRGRNHWPNGQHLTGYSKSLCCTRNLRLLTRIGNSPVNTKKAILDKADMWNFLSRIEIENDSFFLYQNQPIQLQLPLKRSS